MNGFSDILNLNFISFGAVTDIDLACHV